MKTRLPLEFSAHLASLEKYFATMGGVVFACLFGSQARGQATSLSDVDIAVLLDPLIAAADYLDLRLKIIGGLMSVLNTNDIDVLVLNQAPLALRYRVLRDGALIYCRQRDRLIEFSVRTISDYLDFKPVLERHEQSVLNHARKGELVYGYNPDRGALERYREIRERLERTSKSDL